METSALVLVGNGIGNVIEQTPLIIAAVEMYDHVDVWIPQTKDTTKTFLPAALELISDLPGVRSMISCPAKDPPKEFKDAEPYTAVFPTYLIGNYCRKFGCNRRYHSPAPKDCVEGKAVMRGIRKAGFEGEIPKPYCGWDPPPLDWRDATPVVGLSAGSNPKPLWKRKRYKSWEAVVDFVLEQTPEVRFAQFGADCDDTIEHEAVMDMRHVPIRECAGRIRECDLFVANDCGLAHVAAALEVPTLVLFGPTYIKKSLPRFNAEAINLKLKCQPCQYRAIGRYRGKGGPTCKNECMKGLHPSYIGNRILEGIGYDELCVDGIGKERDEVSRYVAKRIADLDRQARARRENAQLSARDRPKERGEEVRARELR